MKYFIKDEIYVNPEQVILKIISDDRITDNCKKLCLRSYKENHLASEYDELFTIDVDGYDHDYVVLYNKELDLAVVVRDDNFDEVNDDSDVLEELGVEKVLRNNNTTVMIFDDGSKEIVTKHQDDEDDEEKAVMLCLLKSEGYTYSDIEALVRSIKYQVEKQPTNLQVKPTKK